ncbi:hypothetical protein ONS95_009540 [Cadophora gregata]|uniref:uncharacterized protein n=1 Tax=Cadophora gregata TaxID=51156 RepID=UPI0026DB32AE|nr:uncharacterized protein ONS95_009540 [Cadophora gregata]KAK0124591.1 hypothetical protein ONS95_009540 [Cadophora gregata]KAK0129552.1 hypothetical protein ONS96_000117 [Cadophora gregata f. sp. sojae]
MMLPIAVSVFVLLWVILAARTSRPTPSSSTARSNRACPNSNFFPPLFHKVIFPSPRHRQINSISQKAWQNPRNLISSHLISLVWPPLPFPSILTNTILHNRKYITTTAHLLQVNGIILTS